MDFFTLKASLGLDTPLELCYKRFNMLEWYNKYFKMDSHKKK